MKKISKITLLLISVTLVLAQCYWYYRRGNDDLDLYILIFIVFMGTSLIALVFLKKEIFINIKFIIVSIFVSLWVFEIYDLFSTRLPKLYFPSLEHKIQDYRTQELNAHPSIFPSALTHSDVNRYFGGLWPLGGVPDAITVMTVPGQTYAHYLSDRYGFRNPNSAWTDPRYAFVGDSFTHGWGARDGEIFASLFRDSVGSTVNAAIRGNGPLLELATYREYLRPSRPEIVFWVFWVGNDLSDLEYEWRHSVLKNYLDPLYSQNLLKNEGRIKSGFKTYSSDILEERLNKIHPTEPLIMIRHTIGLFLNAYTFHTTGALLKEALENLLKKNTAIVNAEKNISTVKLATISKMFSKEVTNSGVDLIFVFLPDSKTCSYVDQDDPRADAILSVVRSKAIRVLNLSQDICDDGGYDLNTLPGDPHLNARGHRIVAERLIRFVESEFSHAKEN